MEALFIIIIVGILSAIFGNGKMKTSNQAFSKESFQEFKKMLNNKPNDGTEKQTITASDPIVSEIKDSNPSQSLKEKYHHVRQKSRGINEEWTSAHQIMEQHEKEREMGLQHKKREETEENLFEEPNTESIINGIIWSEILGEPRSKKPYSPRNF